MITKEQIDQANSQCKPIDIGRKKKYVEVNERIKAFRGICPDASIVNEILSCEGGNYIVKTSILIDGIIVAVGHAQERTTSSGVNSTSALENCETSAVGRALAFLGIGTDEAITSAQELIGANQGQEELAQKLTKEEVKEFEKLIKDYDINVEKLLAQFSKKSLNEFTSGEYLSIKSIAERKKKKDE